MMMKKQMMVLWVLAAVALTALPGCDGRVMMMGHVMSLGVSIWMVWSTLNLTKAKKS